MILGILVINKPFLLTLTSKAGIIEKIKYNTLVNCNLALLLKVGFEAKLATSGGIFGGSKIKYSTNDSLHLSERLKKAETNKDEGFKRSKSIH